ncbi:MAG TPA: hypothetical protein VHQ43_05160 [Solirubrobacterales bacterium]|nr:hypothetical protein [Solirubrobacterales bacterium]
MVRDQEETLRRTATAEIGALPVAEQAGEFLADALRNAPVRPSPEGEKRMPAEFRQQALWMMGVQSFRALRAALGIIASGYDDQAVGHVRLISELHGRARKVFEDESGEYARQWIAGRAGGSGAKVVGQDLWEVLSGPPHPSARATFDWTALSPENGPTLVVLGPERRPDLSNGTLAFIAGEIRDIGYVLATASGLSGVLPEFLDAVVLAAHERYLRDDPGGD